MPDGVAALRQLGVVLGTGHGLPFRGLRFTDDQQIAEACFPDESGIGIRRTALHQILLDRVEAAGIVTGWRAKVTGLEPEGIRIGDQLVRCRWIIGADGALSQIRQWAGLAPVRDGSRRIGLRQHFRVKPWSDFIEVHWAMGCQAYVTPVGPDEVCIALLGRIQELCFTDLALRFPQLGGRLENAKPIGGVRGGFSASTRLRRVTAHRRICRMPFLMAHLLLLMDNREGLRKIALQALTARPRIFSRLIAAHVGARHPAAASLDVLALSLSLLKHAADAAR
jgi:menaquinone-9 beta-reductase